MKILLCTPSPDLIKPLHALFYHLGIWSDTCSSIEEAQHFCQTDSYGAVVAWHENISNNLLENFAKWKRESGGEQFVVVTSRQSGLERARFLEAGVDHYLIAPFSYAKLAGELLVQEFESGYDVSLSYSTNHFNIQPLSRSISYEGQLLDLTRREFDILACLLRNRGRTVSRLQIWEEVWGSQEDISLSNPIDVHILRLRKKLAEEARCLIRAIPGIGYRMHAKA